MPGDGYRTPMRHRRQQMVDPSFSQPVPLAQTPAGEYNHSFFTQQAHAPFQVSTPANVSGKDAMQLAIADRHLAVQQAANSTVLNANNNLLNANNNLIPAAAPDPSLNGASASLPALPSGQGGANGSSALVPAAASTHAMVPAGASHEERIVQAAVSGGGSVNIGTIGGAVTHNYYYASGPGGGEQIADIQNQLHLLRKGQEQQTQQQRTLNSNAVGLRKEVAHLATEQTKTTNEVKKLKTPGREV